MGVGLKTPYTVILIETYTICGIILPKGGRIMKITLETMNEKLAVAVEPTENEQHISYDDILNAFMAGLSSVTVKLLNEVAVDDREALYMSLDAVLQRFLLDMFPEFELSDDEKFTLSDAALIKAQDDIINEAHKEGITFKEALARYEKEAEEYFNAGKMS